MKKYLDVFDKKMAYVEIGDGDPIVFLHGNPTSSHLWRNILPQLAGQGRCIAPDLIGMGDSDKLDNPDRNSYRFSEHRRYLDEFFNQMNIDSNVVLVIHDWGSGLGFDWANRHRDAVQGIAYMEAIVRPVTWAEWPDSARNIFQAMRSDAGEEIVLEKNIFVERIFPSSILRELSDEELAPYRQPFLNPGEDRRPTLTWPREIPVRGENCFPDDGRSEGETVAIVDEYSRWLAHSPVPKLFINAQPGSILVGTQREFCRSWPNQIEVTVAGAHFIQEDSPDEIAAAVSEFVSRLR